MARRVGQDVERLGGVIGPVEPQRGTQRLRAITLTMQLRQV